MTHDRTRYKGIYLYFGTFSNSLEIAVEKPSLKGHLLACYGAFDPITQSSSAEVKEL